MKKEVLILIEEMIKTVAKLDNKGVGEIDNIWDRNYDRLIELVVDENCGDKVTCDEEVIHDEMADIRVLYYKKAEEY